MRIGACTTWSRLIAADLPPAFDALKAAGREIGSPQIQNVATLAGNLCNASPAADGVPPLLVLDAEVELCSREGMRRVPLSDFIQGNRRTLRRPDELLTGILVPALPGHDRAASAFRKLGARRYLVISIAMVAALILVDDEGRVTCARVAVGSCSAVARRLGALEAVLQGAAFRRGLSDLVQPEHLETLSPIDDLRATAAYRGEAALELVRRTLDACLEGLRREGVGLGAHQ